MVTKLYKQLFYFFLFSLSVNFLQAANIRAKVDALTVNMSETFTLTLSADEQPDEQPDLSVLKKDFEVLGSSQNSSFSSINGVSSNSINWEITLLAKHEGGIAIPPIAFGQDKSQALLIQVTAAKIQNDLILILETATKKVYQQQELLVTLRYLHNIQLSNAQLTEPSTNDPDIESTLLQQTESKVVTYKGHQYYEVDVVYALTPSKAGQLIIKPVNLQGYEKSKQRRSFGGFSVFNSRGKLRRVVSNSLKITVEAKPANAADPWLPARNLSLSESWSNQQWKVGDSITRTIILIGDGLNQNQLPEINMPANAAFKLYPDKPQLKTTKYNNGLTSTLKQQFAVVPLQAGEITLPEIKINWWNTEKNQAETTILKARTVQVIANPDAILNTQPPIQQAPLAQDLNKNINLAVAKPEIIIKQEPRFYFWLMILFALLWLLTLLSWWFSRTRVKKPTSPKEIKPKASLKALKSACLSQQPNDIKQQLLIWAKARWSVPKPNSLTAISGLAKDNELTTEINLLEQVLYHNKEDYQNGETLFKIIQQLPEDREVQQAVMEIPPLYGYS